MKDDDPTRDSESNPGPLQGRSFKNFPVREWEATLSALGTDTQDVTDLNVLSFRYSELTPIGSGGMGIVLRARDLETGELVALKILKQRIAAEGPEMERFKEELRLARKVTHKNVCRVYEFHRIGGLPCISMEYVQGESLRMCLRSRGRLEASMAIRIAKHICGGLREAHAQGVIHRDLKPENLMIDDSGNVRIMDFGIAQSLRKPERSSDGLVGTLAYMAPEQVQGAHIDVRTDIYAFGLILYEMLTGITAFVADDPRAAALKRLREVPRLPREIAPDINEHIERVIMKCLEKDPDKRFQSVEELEAALTAECPNNLPPPALKFCGPSKGNI